MQSEIGLVLQNVSNNYFGREKEIVSGIIKKLNEIQDNLEKEII